MDKVFILSVERADDCGVKFDAVPFKEKEKASEEARKRVEAFKDDMVREYAKDGFLTDNNIGDKGSIYCSTDWSMSLYVYCTIKEFDI